ncbi:ABC transporter substrate-binding protein [Pseudooceanicola nanhaiensis]|nr:ABC transporter substrate-binding protein [Pseudooceanicola nanhaiensis]
MFKKTLSAALLGTVCAALPAFAQDPVAGGRLNLLVQPEPSGLMLGITTNAATNLVSGGIYEGLLRYDQDLTPEPSLAKSWEISEDGLTYTFHLQEGVKWHDGEPMTAHDVVFTFTEFLTETQPRHRNIMNRVASVEAPDELTVVFTLKQAFGPFIRIFAYKTAPIVPAHIYEGTDFRANEANATPIGTGPFKLDEWQRGAYIGLVKNEDYWMEGRPYLDEVIYHIIPDAASRANAYETGDLDVLPGGTIENFDIVRLQKNEGTCVDEGGWQYSSPMAWMWLNNRNAPLDNPKMRQAIMYALDRELALQVVWNGFGRVAKGPIASTTPFFDETGPLYEHNPEKAKELLAEIGYDGTPLRMLPLPYGETWQRWAEVVRQNLAQVGITLQTEATDVAGWNQKTSQWDYDLAFTFVAQNGDPELGVARNYISSQIAKGNPFNNVEGYSNPKVDELFAKAAVAVSTEERQALYTEVQQILQEDVPIAWLQELSFPTVYDCGVHNLITTANGAGNSLRDTWKEQ